MVGGRGEGGWGEGDMSLPPTKRSRMVSMAAMSTSYTHMSTYAHMSTAYAHMSTAYAHVHDRAGSKQVFVVCA
jgi:hypothetical protein